jgi:hypothetical protein
VRPQLDPAEALVDVVVPRRFAVLAVADDVDAGLALARDDVAHGVGEAALVSILVVGLAGVDRAQERDQIRGAHETAGVRHHDAVAAHIRDLDTPLQNVQIT